MRIEESIGRFNIRKTLRFEMKPIGKIADFLEGHLAADEERAASLNMAKAAIEAEHGRALYEKKRLEKETEERLLAERRARKAANRAQSEADLTAHRHLPRR